MKTPRFLLLAAAVLGAVPVKAEIKPGDRCDKAWLTDALVAATTQGRFDYNDERIDGTGKNWKLKVRNAKTCDLATWSTLAVAEGAGHKWRSETVGTWWTTNSAFAQQAGFILAVDEGLAKLDARALAVLAAADEAIDAAVGLGLVAATPAEKSIVEVTPGVSGGPIGALKPRVVTVHEAGKQTAATVARREIGATYRKLVNDAGGAMTPGTSILKFRKAVLELGLELDRLGKSKDLIKKHTSRSGSVETVLFDFPSGFAGLPNAFAPLPATEENAMNDEKFGVGHAILTGGPDATDSALHRYDAGFRALLLQRYALLRSIREAAKKRLETKPIAVLEAEALAEEQVNGSKVAKGSLAEATMRRLVGSKDYADLAQAFDAQAAKGGDAWVKGAGAPAKAQLDAMRAAAETATVEEINGKKTVTVMVNNRKRILGNVPANMDDAATREYAADQVADLILRGEKDSGRIAAAIAAIKGENPTDATVPADFVGKVPPAPEVPKSDWAKAKDSKDASCGSPSDLGKSEMERIAARRAERAADIADEASKGRRKLQKALNDSDEAIIKKCKEKENAIATQYINPDIKDQAAERRRLLADLRTKCNAEIEAERKKIWDRPEFANLLDSETAETRKAEELAIADRDIASLYDSGITDALVELERKYKTKGDSHRLHIERATGYKDDHYDLERVTRYFDENWRKGDENSRGRYADCRGKFGYVAGKSPGSKLQNPRADREEGVEGSKSVDMDCGVRAGLVAHMSGYKGQVTVEGGAVAEPANLAGSENVDDVLKQRRAAPKK